jgi:hypothetical protein
MMAKRLSILILLVLMLGAFSVPVSHAQTFGCYASLPARLTVGAQGRVTPGLPNALRTQPNRSAGSFVIGEIPAGGVFTVLAGPNCSDSMNWWQVNYNGLIGWTAEGSAYGTYWLEPVVNATCMSLPSRLYVGTQGRVTPGDPNVLRSQPFQGGGSIVLAYIPAGDGFIVVGGPSCSNGITWWQVNYFGTIGWTPEGQNFTYWTEPIFSLPPTPTPIPQGCSLPTHMLVGYTGIVTPGLPNRLRSTPSLTGRFLRNMNAGETFNVLSGPHCADGMIWYQVRYRGTAGWTAEGQGTTYYIDPLICPGFLPSQIAAGYNGVVTPGLPNRLRSQAATWSATLTTIPAGGVFSVVGGPVCSENAAWWQVRYGGITGWTMEGQGGTYWLTPLFQ